MYYKLCKETFYILQKFTYLYQLRVEITCSGKRSAKVSPEVTDKEYGSTKSMYYHGMKLHMLGFGHVGKLPYPEQILFTPASVNDIKVYKQAWTNIENRTFFGDKIYMDHDLNQQMI